MLPVIVVQSEEEEVAPQSAGTCHGLHHGEEDPRGERERERRRRRKRNAQVGVVNRWGIMTGWASK